MKRKLTPEEKIAAIIFARMGGQTTSKKKSDAARRNGKLGGRPKNKLK